MVSEDSRRRDKLITSLNNEGFYIVNIMPCNVELLPAVLQSEPDVLVIEMDIPDEHIFDQLSVINNEFARPVVFFTDKGSSHIIKNAVKMGIGAFIVDGLSSRKMSPIIELAIERFTEAQSLYQELINTKRDLEERKIVERAKGILMKHKNLSEDEAYASIRKIAMDKNKKLIDIAKNIINVSEIFI